MNIIRIGNDINIRWKVFYRDGIPYLMDDKRLDLWLVSGPFKTQIASFQVEEYEVTFSIDADYLKRYGTYKVILRIKDENAVADDATIDLVHIFQIVAQSYPNPTSCAVEGSVDLAFQSIINSIVAKTERGESAYEVAVRNGYVGTEEEWLESLHGEDGEMGPVGRMGPAGLQGPRGPQGPAGLTGAKGAKGDKGDTGATLGQVALTTDLDETETGKALDASAMQTIPSMVDAEDEIEEVPSNYYTRVQVNAMMDAERVARESADLKQDSEIAQFEETIRNQVNSYKPIVIDGDVTNAPDEEDITSKNGLLKLKDRNSLNGKGYVIPRRNKTFKEQVAKANTIYDIRYDFDLREPQEDLHLISEFYFGGIIYYSNEEAIALNSYQAIWVPDDCVVLNEAKDTLLSVNSSYLPPADENVFVACTESKTIGYALSGIVEIPEGCTLKMEGGSIDYGVLLMNGSNVLPCFNSIMNTDLVVGGMPKAGVFYFQNGIPTWSNGENWVNASGEIVD